MSLLGTSLVVHWLRLCASTAGGTGSMPGRGTRIPHASQCRPKKVTFVLKIIHDISFNSIKAQVPTMVSESHKICTISLGSHISHLTHVQLTPPVTNSDDLNRPGMSLFRSLHRLFSVPGKLSPWIFTLLTSLVSSSVGSTVSPQ